jgi:hypothetical protein
MAGILSKGITLSMGGKVLADLMEIPELGGETESVDVTTLADGAYQYIDGLKNYGDSLDFKFLYVKEQFTELSATTGVAVWKVELPDGATCTFSGTCSVRLGGVGVNSPITYILAIKPTSEMEWA